MKNSGNFIWITVFSIAMGFLEAAVVIYLRRIYYPGGFDFPLRPMDGNILTVEILREAATIVMLLGIGALTGKTRAEKFAGFIYSFAIWDLFYYMFLWIFIGWPRSVFDWDILFLLPVPWFGPVLAPVILSITMILLSAFVFFCVKTGSDQFGIRATVALALGSLVVVISFTEDFVKKMQPGHPELAGYAPTTFNWAIFSAGELLLLLGCFFYFKSISASRAHMKSK